MIARFFLFALITFATGARSDDFDPGAQSVLLRDVDALTFRAGEMTAYRRVPPAHQLTCLGHSDLCRAHAPNVVQCKNVGTDGVSVQWRCEAQMSNAVKFGKLNVECEGYAYKGDERVLKGSCGLEYELERVVVPKPMHKSTSPPSDVFNVLLTLVISIVVTAAFAVFFCILCGLLGHSSASSYHHHYGSPAYAPSGGVVHHLHHGGGSGYEPSTAYASPTDRGRVDDGHRTAVGYASTSSRGDDKARNDRSGSSKRGGNGGGVSVGFGGTSSR
jgi:hypothetical protein